MVPMSLCAMLFTAARFSKQENESCTYKDMSIMSNCIPICLLFLSLSHKVIPFPPPTPPSPPSLLPFLSLLFFLTLVAPCRPLPTLKSPSKRDASSVPS